MVAEPWTSVGLAVVVAVITILLQRCAAALAGLREGSEALRSRDSGAVLGSWTRIVRGARRLRRLRRIWHHLGEFLKDIKRSGQGLEDSVPPARWRQV